MGPAPETLGIFVKNACDLFYIWNLCRSTEDEPRFVIGMDAHSKKLAISIWDWSDRFNPCFHREIKCMDIEAMVATYERHVDLGFGRD